MASAIAAPLRPLLLIALSLISSDAAIAQTLEPPQEITLDLDGDGKIDRAVILASPSDDGVLDLHIHLGSGNGAKPDVIRTAISEQQILTFESREKGTLSLTSCDGCGARKSSEETLTMVWRDGALFVGGYTRHWEWYTPFADGTDELLIGGCRIDFLTGQGWLSKDLEDETPAAERFKPIRLDDWSGEALPAICEFQPDITKKRL